MQCRMKAYKQNPCHNSIDSAQQTLANDSLIWWYRAGLSRLQPEIGRRLPCGHFCRDWNISSCRGYRLLCFGALKLCLPPSLSLCFPPFSTLPSLPSPLSIYLSIFPFLLSRALAIWFGWKCAMQFHRRINSARRASAWEWGENRRVSLSLRWGHDSPHYTMIPLITPGDSRGLVSTACMKQSRWASCPQRIECKRAALC